MKEVLTLGVKAVNGGLFVVAFAVVAEVLIPKRFAGLFSAAPSVALANLLVVLIVKGRHHGVENGLGMVVGGLAMAGACLAGMYLVPHLRARRASAAICVIWLAVTEAGYLVALR